MKIISLAVCLLACATVQAQVTKGMDLEGCFQIKHLPANATTTTAFMYTGECKIGCNGIQRATTTDALLKYDQITRCADFDLPDTLSGSPCFGGREHISVGFPVQINGLQPNYEEIVDDEKSCVPGSTTGICRAITLGSFTGSQLGAPDGYFDATNVAFGSLDFKVNGDISLHKIQVAKSTSSILSFKVVRVSASVGDRVTPGDELYQVCTRNTNAIIFGHNLGSPLHPDLSPVNYASCGSTGTSVNANITGTVLSVPTVGKIYINGEAGFGDRCIYTSPAGTGSCKDENGGTVTGSSFSTLCGGNCVYHPNSGIREIVFAKVERKEYAFTTEVYSAQVRFTSSTTGVQLNSSAVSGTDLIMRARCLYHDCQVDANKRRPDAGDPPSSGNPKVHRQARTGSWDSTNSAYNIGPREGLRDWLNKVDVDTITVDFSFDTTSANGYTCPFAGTHPKDQPLYCASGSIWSVDYTVEIDPLDQPESNGLTTGNNCCTGYRAYACRLEAIPRPTHEEWETFNAAGTIAVAKQAVRDWYKEDVNKQQSIATYVDHTASVITSGGLRQYPSKACPTEDYDYTTDADCDGKVADTGIDDYIPSAMLFPQGSFDFKSQPIGSNNMADEQIAGGTDDCRFAPSSTEDGCPPTEDYWERGNPNVIVAARGGPIELDSAGVCSYEPSPISGKVDVDLTVNGGDWDLCAWSGNWSDIQTNGPWDPETECSSVSDALLVARASDRGDGENESLSLDDGMEDISVCVVPYNDTAKECLGACYEGPTYKDGTAGPFLVRYRIVSHRAMGVWGTGFDDHYLLYTLPEWASAIYAIRKPNDTRLKIFLADGFELPAPIVILKQTIEGTGLREDTAQRMWELDVNSSTLDDLGVPNE